MRIGITGAAGFVGSYLTSYGKRTTSNPLYKEVFKCFEKVFVVIVISLFKIFYLGT